VPLESSASVLRKPLRARYGAWLGRLSIAAYFKAGDIARCQWDADLHKACGKDVDYWIKRYHYTANCTSGSYAENLYWGSGYLGTAREAVRWWLNSPYGHRDALLSTQYTQHGMYVRRISGTFRGYADTQVWVHYLCR
jgi:uncharacterized protein YkwD